MLEGFIKSGDRKQQAGLDALIACYLKLKGKDGLPLIVDKFLKDEQVEYVDTLSAVSALRFHGTEVDFIPRKEIVAAVRTLLDRPKIADMIIPDLARWEDWSVMERLVKMFKDSNEDTSWLRVPIASYLRSCPRPEAKTYIEELKKIDPDSIKRADFFLDFNDETEEDESEDAGDGTPLAESTKSSEMNIVDEAYVAHRLPMVDDSKDSTIANIPPRDAVSESTGVDDSNRVAVAAESVPALTPVAQSNVDPVSFWQLILIPFAFSMGILILLWSVISGWFDRLIY